MAKLIKGQVQAEAAERRQKTQGRPPKGSKGTGVSQDTSFEKPRPDKNKSRNQIASTVGMGHCTLERATSVVENGTQELVEVMDKKAPHSGGAGKDFEGGCYAKVVTAI